MEMERINDDLIKVFINVEDLEERGIDFIELISDQRNVEKFFYSILEEVDVEKTFYDSEAITFQVIPSSDGIELYISRSSFEDMDNFFEKEIMKRLRDRKARLKRDHKVSDKGANLTAKEAIESLLAKAETPVQDETDQVGSGIVRFDRLEDFINFAREEAKAQAKGDLYLMNHRYFYIFKDDEQVSEDQVDYLYGRMLEFGEPHPTTENILIEYGELLRADDAISFFGTHL